MKSLDPKALEAASRAFRRMHNSVCYPSASENEANWAASEIVSAYLAALDANTNPPDPDLSSLRKGAEVAVKPLEWVTHDPDCWYARCPVSSKEYYVIREDGRWWATWDLRIPAFDTAEEGKSAAQSDFETRIRSALIGGGQ